MTGDRAFYIGDCLIENRTVMAPLAGITNLPLRLIARECGCGLVCSEMISANGLHYRAAKTCVMLKSNAREKPLSVQIFGSEPSVMADAAAMTEAAGADIVDINFGCSVKKVVKTGAGAALMRTPGLAAEVIRAVRDAVRIPVTIKMRSGWDASGDEARSLARMAEDLGVNAVAVHPRTARQGFTGRANWALIRDIKEIVRIPVIGNGDIVTADDAVRMMEETGCDAVMVGRAAIGNPLLFAQINARFSGESEPAIELNQRFAILRRYLDESFDYLGEKTACYMMRSRLGWFARGLRHSSHFRQSIKLIGSRAEVVEKVEAFRVMAMRHLEESNRMNL